MPIPSDKLEGKRKLMGIALSMGLAVVLFLNAYINTGRNSIPKDIASVKVGDNITWEETVMRCTLTVYNVISVLPPRVEDAKLVEADNVCGSLACSVTSPIVHQLPHRESYSCFKLSEIKSR